MPTEIEQSVLDALQGLLERTMADSQLHHSLEDMKREEAIYIRRTIDLYRAEIKARDEIEQELEERAQKLAELKKEYDPRYPPPDIYDPKLERGKGA